jgi:hypothetical protein
MCNAGWRTLGPVSLPLAAHRLPMWAPKSPRYRAASLPLGLRPLPEARRGRRFRQSAACLPKEFLPRPKAACGRTFAELLGRSFLPFANFAAVDHHIMRVALSLDLDLAKFDQSCFRISIFPGSSRSGVVEMLAGQLAFVIWKIWRRPCSFGSRRRVVTRIRDRECEEQLQD